MDDVDNYLVDMLDKHIGIITQKTQQTLSEAIICGAGAGGVGGQTYLVLARLGCRRFRIADGGVFEASNANRQAGCRFDTVGKNKAAVVAEEIKSINPSAEIAVFANGLMPTNVHGFVQGGSILIDGIDSDGILVKRALFDTCRKEGLTVLMCPVFGFGAALGIFHPIQSPGFEEYFGVIPNPADAAVFDAYRMKFGARLFGFQPKLDEAMYARRVQENKPPSTGISCLLSAAITASAVIDQLSGNHQFPVAPATIHIDLMEQRVETVYRG